jgi:HEPN domain-containing protein
VRGLDIAEAMLQQAHDRLDTAERASLSGNYSYAVRSSQECVELSLKAALRAVGVEYPKRHDVSRVLLRVKDRFPESFAIEEFVRTSRELVELREPAMYGDEIRMISSSALFRSEQAEQVLGKARRVHKACQALIRDLRSLGTKPSNQTQL